MSAISDKEIREGAHELFKNQESFTAFDVTLKLQELGYDIKHRPNRDLIHRTINQMLVEPPYSGFSITNVRKHGISLMVYHDHSADPYQVQLSKNVSTAPSNVPKTTSPSKTASYSSRKKSTDLYDNRGRYTIPSKIMKGFLQTVYVESAKRADGSGYLEITDDPMSDGVPFNRCETVFRISPRWFKKTFGTSPSNLDMTHLPQVAGGYSSVIITEK